MGVMTSENTAGGRKTSHPGGRSPQRPDARRDSGLGAPLQRRHAPAFRDRPPALLGRRRGSPAPGSPRPREPGGGSGTVAGLDAAALRELVDSDRRAAVRAVDPAGESIGRGESAEHLAEALRAVERLDGTALESVLRSASVDLSAPVLGEQVLMPLMKQVGDRWRDGSMRIAHEHLTTAVVRSFLGRQTPNSAVGATAPEIVIATPAGTASRARGVDGGARGGERRVEGDLPRPRSAGRRSGDRDQAATPPGRGDEHRVPERPTREWRGTCGWSAARSATRPASSWAGQRHRPTPARSSRPAGSCSPRSTRFAPVCCELRGRAPDRRLV